MGHRTQLHIKRKDQFYVIHNQWGTGTGLTKDLKKVMVELDASNTSITCYDFLEKLKDSFVPDGEYFIPDDGDNDNGFCLLDCDKKAYAFLLGAAHLRGVRYDTPCFYRQIVTTSHYISIGVCSSGDEQKNHDYGKDFDNFLQNARDYNLMANYDWEKERGRPLLSEFLDQSRIFAKTGRNNNAFRVKY